MTGGELPDGELTRAAQSGDMGALGGSHISSLDEHLVPEIIDDRAALGSMAVPALVIAGRYDVICGIRWARELGQLIPGSRLVVLENSGHFGHLEEPDTFADAVADFIAPLSV